jgi:glutamyl-tRNA synthetase
MAESTSVPVRVRIGPSPTGEPHVGTAYIALFNLAFARRHGGRFVLRIEDTDQERSRPEWEQQIMQGLSWLGLKWDEGPDVGGPCGPYRQSERTAIYAEQVQVLLERGHAYRCFCTRERLDALRETQKANKETSRYDGFCRALSAEDVASRQAEGLPFVVRMKMPLDGETVVQDELRGEVRIQNQQVDDQVLMKSDGFPTYHLANVVDDHLMGITHVIRAEEWISSTPKHVVLYEMFGWTPPKFVHMPLLRNQDKSKISKRKNPVSILDYRDRGFLPAAVINYLAMLGWTMPDGREVFDFDTFVEHFDLSRISLGGPIFDLEKLQWLNGKYYREVLDDEALTDALCESLFARERIRALVPLLKERIDTAEQFVPGTEYFFSGDVAYEAAELLPKKKSFGELREILERFAEAVDRHVAFDAASLEDFCREFAEGSGWKTRDLFMPIRLALTGRSATPPLFDTMAVLGRAKVRRRLRTALERLKPAAAEEARARNAAEQAAKKAEAAAKKDAAK